MAHGVAMAVVELWPPSIISVARPLLALAWGLAAVPLHVFAGNQRIFFVPDLAHVSHHDVGNVEVGSGRAKTDEARKRERVKGGRRLGTGR